MEIFELDLQRFAEGEGAGESAPAEEISAGPEAGAETAAAESGAPAEIRAGDILPNGQAATAQVAAAMTKQMKRHPELRQVYGQNQPKQTQAPAETAGEKTIQQRWEDAKKGEFAELYGQDVQNAIRDRFKNQADANEQLNKLGPMLQVLMDRAEVKSVDDLIHHVMDDDSLYEEEASEAGMTVEAYKNFKEIERQRDEMAAREQQNIQEQRLREHYGNLSRQAEAMKQMYPDFDLQQELKNPQFFRMTSIEGGIPVEDAYFAIHHKELAPQMMAYGMQRARTQMGQTIQAQRQRPAEGAMRSQTQPAAEVRLDPRNLTRRERDEIRRQVHLGKRVTFD